MKLLLDQGLPRDAVERLKLAGVESVHVGSLGLSRASDREILLAAVTMRAIVVTLDADFHAILTESHQAGPSVIRLRIEGLNAEGLSRLLIHVLERAGEELRRGAMVSVNSRRVRVRSLPLGGQVGDGR